MFIVVIIMTIIKISVLFCFLNLCKVLSSVEIIKCTRTGWGFSAK